MRDPGNCVARVQRPQADQCCDTRRPASGGRQKMAAIRHHQAGGRAASVTVTVCHLQQPARRLGRAAALGELPPPPLSQSRSPPSLCGPGLTLQRRQRGGSVRVHSLFRASNRAGSAFGRPKPGQPASQRSYSRSKRTRQIHTQAAELGQANASNFLTCRRRHRAAASEKQPEQQQQQEAAEQKFLEGSRR